jgi:hypothetical protein
MNLFRNTAATALLALMIANAHAISEEKLPARVHVAWAPTAQLTEVKDNQMNRGWMRPEEWMKSLSDHLRMRADRLLPPGEQLQVRINDIKLAGSYEPWHRSSQQDIRFLKDIYPPRIDVHYKLLASDGSTLREGDKKLRDGAYLQRAVNDSTDPLRYDKRLLDDWLNRELRADATAQ